LKGNPYHDEAGQFTDADHAVASGSGAKPPNNAASTASEAAKP
jgi:hypothetical protein